MDCNYQFRCCRLQSASFAFINGNFMVASMLLIVGNKSEREREREKKSFTKVSLLSWHISHECHSAKLSQRLCLSAAHKNVLHMNGTDILAQCLV